MRVAAFPGAACLGYGHICTPPQSLPSHSWIDELEGADSPAVMAGYGVGLPISRLYARYFGGDLNITSMEVGLLRAYRAHHQLCREGCWTNAMETVQGYGTDALLHLHRLGSAEEPLMT